MFLIYSLLVFQLHLINFLPNLLIAFNYSSLAFNLFKSPSLLPFSSNCLLKTLPNGENSNLTFSTTPGLYPKSLPVKYSYFSNSPDDNADILAVCLSKSY